MCVEITTSVLYLQYVASEVVLHSVSYSIKKVLSDWMSGWMKPRTHDAPKALKNQCFEGVCRSEIFVSKLCLDCQIAIIVDHLAKSRVKTLIYDFYGKPQKC